MKELQPVRQVIDDWLLWATWQSDPGNEGKQDDELIGFDELDWLVRKHPDHAWMCILAAVADHRTKPFLGLLAAGPLEDLLGIHGEAFIERIEQEARRDPLFAWTLRGVWQCQMTDAVWSRVQSVWDRRGWDGIPA